MVKALQNINKNIAKKNRFVFFNFTNALLVPNALTEVGRFYRAKGIKNISVFIVLAFLSLLLGVLGS